MLFEPQALECLEFTSTDAAYNLALEEALFRHLPHSHPGYFILWQNKPAVIIGRHQCLNESVNLTLAHQMKLPIVRRISGGGAVYHDLGNLNFSFIIPCECRPGFADFLAPILAALASYGVNATLSGRNDLETDGKKFSGSSQYMAKNTLLHHGTLLVNSNLGLLPDLLKISNDKLASKGISSVKSRVINLSEATAGRIAIPELKRILPRFCSGFTGEIPEEVFAYAQKLKETRYASMTWTFGKSSSYSLEKRKRFPWGEIIARFLISERIIRQCSITGDFFNYSEIRELEEKIRNLPFTPAAMKANLGDVNWPNYFAGCDWKSMNLFFTEDIFI